MSTASAPSILSIPPFTSVASLIKTTFRLFGKYFGQWLGITLRVAGLMLMLNLINGVLSTLPLILNAEPNTASPVNLGLNVVSGCVGLLVLIASIFVPWMNGALIYQTLERVGGRTPGVSDSYRATQPRFGGLWINTFLSQSVYTLLLLPLFLGIYGGLAAAVINSKLIPSLSANFTNTGMTNFLLGTAVICTPLGLIGAIFSLILNLSWAVSGPVIVGEGADGFGAFARSAQLTKGMRFKLLGRFILFGLVISLIFGLPTFVLGLLAAIPFAGSSAPTTFPIFSAIMIGIISLLSGVLGFFQTALTWIFNTLNYLDLRTREELAALPEPERAQRLAAPIIAHTTPAIAASTVIAPTIASRPPSASPVIITSPTPSSSSEPLVIMPNMTPAQKIGVYFNRLRNEGPNSQLLNDMGASYFEVGDLGAALDAYSRARDLNPQDPDIVFNLMRVHISRKDTSAARIMMREYLNLEPNEDDKRRVLANPSYKPFLPQ